MTSWLAGGGLERPALSAPYFGVSSPYSPPLPTPAPHVTHPATVRQPRRPLGQPHPALSAVCLPRRRAATLSSRGIVEWRDVWRSLLLRISAAPEVATRPPFGGRIIMHTIILFLVCFLNLSPRSPLSRALERLANAVAGPTQIRRGGVGRGVLRRGVRARRFTALFRPFALIASIKRVCCVGDAAERTCGALGRAGGCQGCHRRCAERAVNKGIAHWYYGSSRQMQKGVG